MLGNFPEKSNDYAGLRGIFKFGSTRAKVEVREDWDGLG